MKKTSKGAEVRPNLPALMTTEEIAEVLRVTPRCVQKITARGQIPVIRLGRRFTRYDLAKVMSALERREIAEVGRRR